MTTRPDEHNYAGSELLYNALMRPALAEAVALLGLPPSGGRVLDAGCGPGGAFPLLRGPIGPRGRIVGVDFSPAHLAAARGEIRAHGLRGTVGLVRASLAGRLPFRDGAFDVIWAADVLFPSLFADPAKVVIELARTLRPGGTCAIFYGNWLRPLFLPGYARLEHLICAAKELANATARPWEGDRHPERAAVWLRAAGFEEAQTRPLTVVHRAPLPPGVREYLGDYALYGQHGANSGPGYYAAAIAAHGAAVGLGDADRRLWARIANPRSAHFVLDDPDYYCVVPALLALGRKAR